MIEKLIYPKNIKRTKTLRSLRTAGKWLSLFTAILCVAANMKTQTKPWSLLVLWCLFFINNSLLSPPQLEVNLLTQTNKASAFIIGTLVIVGVFFSKGWLGFVLPLVLSLSLLTSAVVFFLAPNRNKNMAMPFITELVLSLGYCAFVFSWTKGANWPTLVLCAISAVLLLVYTVSFSDALIRELVKRFHIN